MTVKTDIDDRLLRVLREAASRPGLGYGRRPEPMRGGFWAELLSFSLERPPDGWPSELVARLMPDPRPARKETIVQRAVAAAGFPTPLVRVSGGPDDGLGRAFMVMDRAAGGPALAGLSGGLSPAAVPRLLRQVPDLLAEAMARLHALDPDLVRDELEKVPEVPVTVPGLLAPRAYDAGFTSLLLSEPPLLVPGWQRPLIRLFGRVLARRFLRGYQRQAGAIEPGELRWHQAIVCLRALVEVAGWVCEDTIGARAGHPWLVSGPAFAGRLTALTGIPVRAL